MSSKRRWSSGPESRLLRAASADPLSDEAYTTARANLSAALEDIAEALRDFEAASPQPNRSSGWAQDLHTVADDLAGH